MKLVELLELISENSLVTVYSVTDPRNYISVYDGKDSIDTAFNDCIVSKIYPYQETICIEIDTETKTPIDGSVDTSIDNRKGVTNG